MTMIKSVTTSNTKDVRKNVRQMSAEVTVEGTGREVLHEFLGILNALEEQCPDLLLLALTKHMEDIKHDC
jgi:hypothetical protein